MKKNAWLNLTLMVINTKSQFRNFSIWIEQTVALNAKPK